MCASKDTAVHHYLTTCVARKTISSEKLYYWSDVGFSVGTRIRDAYVSSSGKSEKKKKNDWIGTGDKIFSPFERDYYNIPCANTQSPRVTYSGTQIRVFFFFSWLVQNSSRSYLPNVFYYFNTFARAPSHLVEACAVPKPCNVIVYATQRLDV